MKGLTLGYPSYPRDDIWPGGSKDTMFTWLNESQEWSRDSEERETFEATEIVGGASVWCVQVCEEGVGGKNGEKDLSPLPLYLTSLSSQVSQHRKSKPNSCT